MTASEAREARSFRMRAKQTQDATGLRWGWDSVFTQPVEIHTPAGPATPQPSARDRLWHWRKRFLWVPAEQISRGNAERRKFQSFRNSCSADH